MAAKKVPVWHHLVLRQATVAAGAPLEDVAAVSDEFIFTVPPGGGCAVADGDGGGRGQDRPGQHGTVVLQTIGLGGVRTTHQAIPP